MSQLILLAGKRQKKETLRQVTACNDYLNMGPGRSVRKLHKRYRELRDDPNSDYLPPSVRLTTLEEWCSRFGWVKRSEEYENQLELGRKAHIERIMQTGLATEHERVDLLKKLAETLTEEIFEEGEDGVLHNLWLPDVKQVGSGKNITRVDIERYNAAIVDNLRGVLDDLAKETGGRVQRRDVTSKGDKVKVSFVGNIDPEEI